MSYLKTDLSNKSGMFQLDVFKCYACDKHLNGTELGTLITYPCRTPVVTLRYCKACKLAGLDDAKIKGEHK